MFRNSAEIFIYFYRILFPLWMFPNGKQNWSSEWGHLFLNNWNFLLTLYFSAAIGDVVTGGDLYAVSIEINMYFWFYFDDLHFADWNSFLFSSFVQTVFENSLMTHHIAVPPGAMGKVTYVAPAGQYSIKVGTFYWCTFACSTYAHIYIHVCACLHMLYFINFAYMCFCLYVYMCMWYMWYFVKCSVLHYFWNVHCLFFSGYSAWAWVPRHKEVSDHASGNLSLKYYN